ncbi:hypothetical protein [Sapientia aquatica]|uniref:Uncharacterized protein n=1 Tax=Sapientia aquatica TaxID=1549640 RepID=A0A4R5VMW3_9BURK|nr:hypothetical protein [Sapientia aquatica]TDK59584.1 hypothetical protein E2I14_18720 [Sapientia aquatica]
MQQGFQEKMALANIRSLLARYSSMDSLNLVTARLSRENGVSKYSIKLARYSRMDINIVMAYPKVRRSPASIRQFQLDRSLAKCFNRRICFQTNPLTVRFFPKTLQPTT